MLPPLAEDEHELDTDGKRHTTQFDPFLLSALARSAAPSTDPEQERLDLARAHDWFVESNLRGSHDLVKVQPRDQGGLEPWTGYGHAALDADALLMAHWHEECAGPTIAKFASAPKRVLDLGCGLYAQWILATARTSGWETTRFVGLDLAPVLVPPSLLPDDMRTRVTFVQHDFLDPLPFFEGEFDYIRCCRVASGIPEPSWDPLIEELKRCLAPGGTLEIIDDSARPTLPPKMRQELDAILRNQYLNVELRTVIPSTLAMNNMHSITTASPASVPALRGRLALDGAHDELANVEVVDRVLLACTARCTSGSASALAQAIASASASEADPSSQTTSPHPDGHGPGAAHSAASAREVRECEAILRSWTSDVVADASIAELMEQQWGWTCRFDQQMETQLNEMLPAVEQRVIDATKATKALERNSTSSAGLGVSVDRLQKVRTAQQQAETRRREVNAQLQAVRRRLGRDAGGLRRLETDAADFRGQAWTCRN
ncbi:hypothetical protein JCM10908_005016 [Rhodotorula pacifica]|uniref:uncharacterized protein n=1 Tax=Rhodotorula pacifica TaxID=1495444 RepID=UPI003180C979